jgi:hypothetical protein
MSVGFRPPTEAELALCAQVYAEAQRAESETGLRVVSVSVHPGAVSEDRREVPLRIFDIPVRFDELVPVGQVFVNLEVRA